MTIVSKYLEPKGQLEKTVTLELNKDNAAFTLKPVYLLNRTAEEDKPNDPLYKYRFHGPDAEPAKLALLGDSADVVFLDEVTPTRILERLGAAGIILCEGGPTLVGQLVAERTVDELNLTVAPTMISGRSARVAHGPPAEPPLDMRLDRAMFGDRSLFLRYLKG